MRRHRNSTGSAASWVSTSAMPQPVMQVSPYASCPSAIVWAPPPSPTALSV